jgi:hypothetical protein
VRRAEERPEKGALEVSIVRHIGVSAPEHAHYVHERRRAGEILVDQVMHGARLRRHREPGRTSVETRLAMVPSASTSTEQSR